MVIDDVKSVVAYTLRLDEKAKKLDARTQLFGSIPEFDSMAVVSVVAALEERFSISIGDDEISADTFETIGSLAKFIEAKLAA